MKMVEKVDYPLEVVANEGEGGLGVSIKYAGELFDRERVKALLDGMGHTLEQVTGNWEIEEKEIRHLREGERQRIVCEWNRTEHEYPAAKTVVELCEDQVERTPGNIAVSCEGKELSYRELNGKANRVARYLRDRYGVGPDDLVALCLDRSELMEIAALGVLKAGGAYVPVGTDYPVERMRYILADTRAKAVLANAVYGEKLRAAGAGPPVQNRDAHRSWHQAGGGDAENPERLAGPGNLAYVIYTSGTTGEPKGAMLEHRGLVNRIWWMNGEYPLNENDVVLQKTPYTFDVSVWELIWALLAGARIAFARPGGHRDGEYLLETIARERVTVVHFVPSMLKVFEETAAGLDRGRCGSLRCLFGSGEALGLRDVAEWRRLFPGTAVRNLYGPTEASIDALCYDCGGEGVEEVLIGKPIWNTAAYILDGEMRPVPAGVAGELHLGGVGVARGYLNKGALTAEKFVANPFQSVGEKERGYNGRLYKTGDLARYRADGNIEYLGRNDFQVKVRGFRIERGEIEGALLGYGGIRQCVVVAVERGGEKCLAAYYVGEGELDGEGIRGYLEGKLPEYMVPAAYMRLEELPLGANGKLDRRALPDPGLQRDEAYEEPRNETEEKLRGLYAEVLGLPEEAIGARADFFRIGGDSIRSIRLANRIQRRLCLPITITDILKYKTIRALCENAASGVKAGKTTQGEQGKLSGGFPLLPSQQYLFDMIDTHKAPLEYYDNYISICLVEIENADRDILAQSLAMLGEYHDAFRLRYQKAGGVYSQQYGDALPEIKFHVLAENSGAREMEIKQVVTAWIRSIHIFSGTLAVFGIINGFEDKRAQVYLLCHHLNTDGVSWRIVGDDLKTLYNYLARSGERTVAARAEAILGPKGTSLRQWSEALLAYTEQMKDEKPYWEDIERSAIVSNRAIAALSSAVMKSRHFDLDEELTEKILSASRRGLETRIDDILLSALNMALHTMTGVEHHCIMMEGHGRSGISGELDVSRTMGWFALPYPVRLPRPGANPEETVGRVKKNLREIPNGGIGYQLLCGGDREQYMPSIYVNYQGEFENNINVEVDVPMAGELFQFEIELIGHIFDRRLRCMFASRLEDDKAAALIRDFEDSLRICLTEKLSGPIGKPIEKSLELFGN
jgi:amino acid adenylation domain-containing protein